MLGGPASKDIKKREVQINELLFLMEVSSGVEPLYTVLQTVT